MPPMLTNRPRLTLVVFCLLVWLPGFFSLPPSDRDEGRFALATRQMVETGDYIRIMNGDVPRNRKPIGIYWLQAPFALAARAAGIARENPIWPFRLPSLLGAMAAVLATFDIGLLLAGDRKKALLAGGMLAAAAMVTVEAHMAKTDAALLGATTMAMAVMARAWIAPGTVRRGHAALFWVALGAGILIKGPITPMVCGLTAVSLCVFHRHSVWLRCLRPGWGLPLMLLMVLPWLIAIGLATHGAFFMDAVGGDLAGKLAGGAEAHGGFPGLHLLLLPLLAFPASAWVLRALPVAWAARRDRVDAFLLAWIIPSWLVFEAVPTKLPHYTLPLYPALFLLAARHGLGPVPPWVRRCSLIVLSVAGITLAAAAVSLPLLLHAPWWLGLAPPCAVALAVWFAWREWPMGTLLAAIPLTIAVLQVELPNLKPLWIAPRIAALLRARPGYTPSGRDVAAAGYAEPSMLFLAGPHILLLPNGGSAANALRQGRDAAIIAGDPARFMEQAANLGVDLQPLGVIAGFNYSRGKAVALSVFARKPEPGR